MNTMKEEDYLPLREVVFMTLRKQILRGELKPGERLMEIALAKKLGVSRTPIREAIRMLEHEERVVMIPRRGAHVADISRQELNDVLEVRMALEVLAARKACARMTQEEIAELDAAESRFEALVSTEDVDINELGEADEQFHDVIYRATQNRRLIQLLNNLREQMYRFRVEYLKDPGVRRELILEHSGMIRAFREKDVEECVEITGRHIENQQKTIGRGLVEK